MKQFTFQSLLRKGIKRFAELPALSMLPDGRTITYNQLGKKTELISTYLMKLGIGRGNHVATLIPNSLESVMFGLAIQQCGATLIPLAENLGAREIAFILNEAKPQVVIMSSEAHCSILLHYLNNSEDVKIIGLPEFDVIYPEEFEIFQWPVKNDELKLPVAENDDIALISYTGGTTGTPKGVMHSQEGLGAAMISAMLEDPLDDRDRLLVSTPIVHSAGSLLWRSLLSGVHIHILKRFNPEQVIQNIEKYKITTTFMVPTMIYRLLDQMKKTDSNVNSMRNIFYGSSPISPSRLKEAFEVFGPILRQQYGMTECNIVISRFSKSAHLWAYEQNQEVLKSCGKPCLYTDVKIIDDKGNSVQSLELGEIIVKSPAMMVGYYQKPEQTKDAIRDGWFHTGDIGKIDENGFLYILDRKKDMIISGGMNVYSSEVERIVNQYPPVALSACIGVPHSDWGEAVCVIVSLRDGFYCTEEEIIQYCKQKTAKYMVPKMVYFLNQFPLTPIGKINKKELKKMYAEGTIKLIQP